MMTAKNSGGWEIQEYLVIGWKRSKLFPIAYTTKEEAEDVLDAWSCGGLLRCREFRVYEILLV